MYLRAFSEGVNIVIVQEKSLRRDKGGNVPLTLKRDKGGTALLGCARAPQHLRVEHARTSQGVPLVRFVAPTFIQVPSRAAMQKGVKRCMNVFKDQYKLSKCEWETLKQAFVFSECFRYSYPLAITREQVLLFVSDFIKYQQ
jgi:hypothetical protein